MKNPTEREVAGFIIILVVLVVFMVLVVFVLIEIVVIIVKIIGSEHFPSSHADADLWYPPQRRLRITP